MTLPALGSPRHWKRDTENFAEGTPVELPGWEGAGAGALFAQVKKQHR